MLATGLVVAIFGLFAVAACDNPNRSQVERLLAKQSTKDEVAAALGWSAYTWYVQGDRDLAAFLAREPSERYKPLREAVRDGRRIMFNTTEWDQTWLFFDASDRLVGYWFNTQ
jgi:hypothetical protein